MSTDDLKQRLAKVLRGDVSDDPATLKIFSRDASLFTRTPSLIVYPKDAKDLASLVDEIARARAEGLDVSLTARAAATDMSGGSLTTSVVVSFTKYFNHMGEVGSDYAITEPGVFYRDFEKATLEKNLILPSYPASRELCAMGGIVANNSAGERTLEYGQTERYIESLDVVLSDGSRATFGSLTPEEVEDKKKLPTLEGSIYRNLDPLLTNNARLIEAHRPKVSKNAAGYGLWRIRDERTGSTNLAKLICGSQGTLALWTSAKLRLIKPKEHRAMLVIFLKDLNILPTIVGRILPFNPESFESYDKHTFELAVHFLPQMLEQMGWAKAARLGIDFLPETAMVAFGGVPEMLLMAEFAEDTLEEAGQKVADARSALFDLDVHTKIEKDERESEKYWIVRRESFSLLRKNLTNLYPVPFIDDFVVPPECYPTFLPKLNALLDVYKDHMVYTIAGHVGNGNFHLIPLMDLTKAENRKIVLELAPKVYELVIAEGGTTTGEHNDGIIRTPFLTMLFGPDMVKLFEETKRIFDPQNVFNPGKKVGGTFADIERDMITTNSH
ncbi:FAD-binding oxidoreductase [Candidatus Kaiserbacteria bacterium CG10_big_fil_rev_8_21_14_0_10_56_12]|uniref:D-lactate dehydrogenase (cytochrome) n=1 Tax=Candidatus Kaiserbacteria bacterium CG10_big_fil_rev_8_21_14_0_10_56_12 TaxID=1974611 RepID=A0A2H0UA50_9BACT|nr:MAG: FAD-binding oxidoreductase [Candidatus Kaiserbacteria bacterium CG10_big_fil_rev_8_21_14_0_10_56_12]